MNIKAIIIYFLFVWPAVTIAEINYQSTGNSVKLLPGSVIKPITTITPYGINSMAIQDAVFGSLDQSQINTGILTDYGLDLADHTLYNGSIGTNNQMTIGAWRGLHASLLTSVINPSSNMISLKAISQQFALYGYAYTPYSRKWGIYIVLISNKWVIVSDVAYSQFYYC